ncbi:MAG: BLUF domain-containing protein [Pseudomonadota bacterium]
MARPQNDTLGMLLYTSHATHDFDDEELRKLVSKARKRNRQLGVTGAVFYEDGRFLQWLEGPIAALDRLYDDIGHDKRHNDLEMVCHGLTNHRMFADWDMHLFNRRGQIENALHGFSPRQPNLHGERSIRKAATRLYEGDDSDFIALLAQQNHLLCDEIALCDRVMRDYDHMWKRDICSELDITLGLSQLLSAFRRWRRNEPICASQPGRRPLLVVTLPGETHLVGASLAAERLMDAGRDVTIEFPSSNHALCRQLADVEYGGLTIVTSGVFAREQWADRLHSAIIAARGEMASDTRIISCGQFGLSRPDIAQTTGFDACCCSANDLPNLFAAPSQTRH